MECVPGTADASLTTQAFEFVKPPRREPPLIARVAHGMLGYTKPLADSFCADLVDDRGYGKFVHRAILPNYLADVKPTKRSCAKKSVSYDGAMTNDPKPFADIAQRLLWHRTELGLSQADYAKRLGVKRSAYSLWEAGSHRLSLNGALVLRKKYGLSLDFLYEGIDDALPMTLRNAWLDRP